MRNNKNLLHGKNILLFTIILVFSSINMAPSIFGDQKIKTPNVSGQFYDSDPKQLSDNINNFFSQASVKPYQKSIDIIISPHAGYVYSGGVAAYGFKAASQNIYKTIIILAPSHYVGFDGISIWDEGQFQTPLGLVDVDAEFSKKIISSHEKYYFEPKAFEREHSLEVEIPFLQNTFKDFKIVPIIFGQPSFSLLRDFAKTLSKIIGEREDVLIIVSTDMSHYHDDVFARKMDSHTIEAIKGLNVDQIWKECHAKTMEMCGFIPVTAALLYAKQNGLNNVEVLKVANSGKINGDMNRVVGYSSILIYGDEKTNMPKQEGVSDLTQQQKTRLIEIARNTLEEFVRTGKNLEVKEADPRFLKEEGAFVTVHKHNRLRGCIGNIIGRGPLYLTVRDMAISSVSQDPRFSPVKIEELDSLEVEVSVLSKPRIIKNVDEIELGVHGVIVSQGPYNHGVFLPQVADSTGWTKEEFLSQLCAQKAKLPADAWKDPKTKIEIFTAEVFSEKDIKE